MNMICEATCKELFFFPLWQMLTSQLSKILLQEQQMAKHVTKFLHWLLYNILRATKVTSYHIHTHNRNSKLEERLLVKER